MIKLSNGHNLEFVVSSGALGWDGKGWLWEKPLIKLKLIDPTLFTIVTKTITPYPKKGKYYVLPIHNGVWNKMGLPNKGIEHWIEKYGKKLKNDQPLILSIAPDDFLKKSWINEIKNIKNIKGIELNISCPNINKTYCINDIYNEYKNFDLPLILKIGHGQFFGNDFIKDNLSLFEALSLNSVSISNGAISGKIIQQYNWPIMKSLHSLGYKVIASSIWEYSDIQKVLDIGCSAVSFGSIHLLRPWAPTFYVKNIREVSKSGDCVGPKNLRIRFDSVTSRHFYLTNNKNYDKLIIKKGIRKDT